MFVWTPSSSTAVRCNGHVSPMGRTAICLLTICDQYYFTTMHRGQAALRFKFCTSSVEQVGWGGRSSLMRMPGTSSLWQTALERNSLLSGSCEVCFHHRW
jgi:hypothetical protein